jgi:hypothetical protein
MDDIIYSTPNLTVQSLYVLYTLVLTLTIKILAFLDKLFYGTIRLFEISSGVESAETV